MRRLTLVAAIAALFFSFSADMALAGDDAAKNVTNKLCPLMGDAVDPKIRTEYEGQFVYFCCAGCVKMFEADPKAAIAKMSDEERAAIAKNATCPVTGEEITSWDTRVEKHGKLVYLCCGGCKTKFEAGS